MSTNPSQKFSAVAEVIAAMPMRFHPEACHDLVAVYVWRLTGSAPQEFSVHVERGTFRIIPGPAQQGDVIFEATVETYLRLSNGQLRGIVAIMTRQLRVRGNLQLAAKMDRIFQ